MMAKHGFLNMRKWRTWRHTRIALAATAAVLLSLGVGMYLSARASDAGKPQAEAAAKAADSHTLELTDNQLQLINIGPVSEQSFPLQREAVGNIDFNEDLSTQVFPPYQGRIVQLYAKLGDNVVKDQLLFTIESPDLIQAESALIAAAGVLDLTTRALERAKQLHDVQGIADKDLEQASSDQQTAEATLKAARDGVAIFGKSPSDIDRMVRTRTIDPNLIVLSPVTGRVTARSAAPGMFVQPGNTPAPYSVADISRVWLNASVTESDMPVVQKGQQIRVSVMAFPARTFEGRISTVGSTVDPQLHRGLVRAEIEDPKHELLPGMFATFVIVTGDPVKSAAVPQDGVVREGDGSMTVWVTADGHHFTQRTVRTGLQSDGYSEILDGVKTGERVVVKGALLLDNMINGGET
jgi:cobalt-zinc-cadmium efflux system membrane fusion protein